MKIIPIVSIGLGGAVASYVAVALVKKDWKNNVAFIAAAAGAVICSAVGAYFLSPKTADEVIEADKKKAEEIKAVTDLKPVVIKDTSKILTQAEADSIADKIATQKKQERLIKVKAGYVSPVLAMFNELKEGGYTIFNEKAVKLTASSQIVGARNAV